jgi:anti-sigma factor RsiW
MTCREVLEFLMQYLDGELPPDQAARFEEHMGVCPACVDYLSTYREAVRLGREACADDNSACKDVPEDLIRAILAARRQGS